MLLYSLSFCNIIDLFTLPTEHMDCGKAFYRWKVSHHDLHHVGDVCIDIEEFDFAVTLGASHNHFTFEPFTEHMNSQPAAAFIDSCAT